MGFSQRLTSAATLVEARLAAVLDAAAADGSPRRLVEAMRLAAARTQDDIVVVCFSGRGDKDCYEVARLQGEDLE